jgi:cytochrome c oxidase cbb3-type subunit 3
MKTTVSILLLAFSGFAYAGTAGAMANDDSIARGKHVFKKYCSKCHGENADGRGRKAYKYKPMPTDFHIAQAARPYMVEITKKGGKAVGRSDDMPEWGGDLTNAQIEDVVSFIMSVRGK